MQTGEISIERAIKSAWESMKRCPVEAILGYLIYSYAGGFLIILCCLAPFAIFPLAGGFAMLYLRIARGEKADLMDLFAGFKDYWKWMGLMSLFMLGFLACLIPAGIGIAVSAFVLDPMRKAAGGSSADAIVIGMVLLIIFGVLVSLLALIILSIRWFFVLFAGADGAGAIESFERSVRMARGHYAMLFLVWLISNVAAGIASLMTMGFGVYFAYPIIMLAYAHIYLDLKPSIEGA